MSELYILSETDGHNRNNLGVFDRKDIAFFTEDLFSYYGECHVDSFDLIEESGIEWIFRIILADGTGITLTLSYHTLNTID